MDDQMKSQQNSSFDGRYNNPAFDNPYQTPNSLLQDVTHSEIILAERAVRLGAVLLDAGVFVILGIFIAVTIPITIGFQRHSNPSSGFLIFGFLIFGLFLFASIIFICMLNLVWLHKYGQTIGKRVCKIKIVRTDGRRVGLGRIIGLRWLPMAIIGIILNGLFYLTNHHAASSGGCISGLVDSLLIFRVSRQCLHDQFADTIVVRAD